MQNSIYGVPTVKIRTLGEFSLEDDECKYIVDLKKQSQVVILLQYIILNRHRIISTEELIDVIWQDQIIENPNNALKNLIYRLRNILSQRLSVSKVDYISHKKGGYMWNDTINTFVDIDELEHFYMMANNKSNTIDIRIKFLTQTMETYKGDFMSDNNSFAIIPEMREKYKNIYETCINKKIELLKEIKNYNELAKYTLELYNKNPQKLNMIDIYLEALYMDSKYNQVIDEYERLTRFLKYENREMSDLGQEIYKKSIKALNGIEFMNNTTASGIANIMNENKKEGAYYCEYETFKDYYRIQMRNIERIAVDMCLVVISVGILNYNNVKNISSVLNVVKNCCIHSLRKGDAITVFNDNQLMLLLYNSNEINGIKVYDRIKNQVDKYYSADDIEINYSIQQLNK